jgi:prefoldin subunit 1
MSRFVMRERDTLDSDNVKMEKTIADDLEQLGKKAKYLEKQFNEANSQLRDIVSHPFCLIVVKEALTE